MVQISRRKHLTLALNIILSVLILSVSPSLQAFAAGKKTIAAVMHSDLRIIDPGFTTAYITRDHGTKNLSGEHISKTLAFPHSGVALAIAASTALAR